MADDGKAGYAFDAMVASKKKGKGKAKTNGKAKSKVKAKSKLQQLAAAIPDEFAVTRKSGASADAPEKKRRSTVNTKAMAAKYQQDLVHKVSQHVHFGMQVSLDPPPLDLTGLVELIDVMLLLQHLNGTTSTVKDAPPLPRCPRGMTASGSFLPCRGALLPGLNEPFTAGYSRRQLAAYEQDGTIPPTQPVCIPCQLADLTRRFVLDPTATFDYTPTFHMPFEGPGGFIYQRCMPIKGVKILAWHDSDYEVRVETRAGVSRKTVRCDRIVAADLQRLRQAQFPPPPAPERGRGKSKTLKRKLFRWRAAVPAQ